MDDVYRQVEQGGAALAAHQPNPLCPVGRGVKGVVARIGERAEAAFLNSLGGQTLADVLREVRRAPGTSRKAAAVRTK